MKLTVPSTRAPTLDLLPLLNVVFLLLIFFLVMAQLGGERSETSVPVSRSATPVGAPTIELQLAADGVLRLDQQVLDDQGVLAALGQPLPARVVLRADAEVNATRALAVVGLLNAGGIGEVQLLTRVP